MLDMKKTASKSKSPAPSALIDQRIDALAEHDGIVCTGETYTSVVKMTFAKGASLPDPKKLFNSSLEGNTRRAISFREGEKIDEAALKALIKAAVALNTAKSKS